MRFRFIAAEKAVFPVRVLCRTLKVSRAGFYAWQARPSAPRARADERLGLEIAAIHAETRQRYGSPRIHAELGERGCRTGRKRVARLMRVRGLAARRRRLVSGHDAVAASVSHRPQRPGAAIRAYWAGPGVGHRHHLHSDGRGLALPGGDPRSLFALRRRLGDERAHHGRPHARRAPDGPGAPTPAAGATPSFRSRQSGWIQPVLATVAV